MSREKLPADFDPYGKDLVMPGSVGDGVFRLVHDKAGNIVRVESLSPEEIEASRRPRKKPKTNKRGNRWL